MRRVLQKALMSKRRLAVIARPGLIRHACFLHLEAVGPRDKPQVRSNGYMNILVADDDPVTRLALQTLLAERGFVVHTAIDGEQAFSILERDDAPRLAIVDWIMPGLNGLELCRKLRESGSRHRTHIVMLTVKQSTENLVAGLDAGADEQVSAHHLAQEC